MKWIRIILTTIIVFVILLFVRRCENKQNLPVLSFTSNADCMVYINDSLSDELRTQDTIQFTLTKGNYRMWAINKKDTITKEFELKADLLISLFFPVNEEDDTCIKTKDRHIETLKSTGDSIRIMKEDTSAITTDESQVVKGEKAEADNKTKVEVTETIKTTTDDTTGKLIDFKKAEPKEIIIEPHDTIEGMVFVQGGTFEMGRDNRKNREKPMHKVKITSFYMDQHEVTVRDYLNFCRYTQREIPPEPAYGWNDNHPIVNISWNDAIAYAEYYGKRLPTEAEWEFAARGGVYFKNYTYAGSSNIDSVAWYMANSGNQAQAVMQKAPNQLNLYDMTGNVWEWCSDWYSENYYGESPIVDPQGPEKSVRTPRGRQEMKYKIIRGGSWGDNPYDAWTTDRRRRTPEFYYHQIGFRCVMDKPNRD